MEGKNGKAPKLLKKKRLILRNATVLVAIMSEVGEALDGYVQTHSEVDCFPFIIYIVQTHLEALDGL
jgi:hypothetical protein